MDQSFNCRSPFKIEKVDIIRDAQIYELVLGNQHLLVLFSCLALGRECKLLDKMIAGSHWKFTKIWIAAQKKWKKKTSNVGVGYWWYGSSGSLGRGIYIFFFEEQRLFTYFHFLMTISVSANKVHFWDQRYLQGWDATIETGWEECPTWGKNRHRLLSFVWSLPFIVATNCQ